MIYLRWEESIDFSKFDTISRFDCGETTNINPRLSYVLDNAPITAIDNNGNPVIITISTSGFDASGLCKITGSIRMPWGVRSKFLRYDLYSDDLSNSEHFFTDNNGLFFFFGVPGQRIKVKFQNDRTYYWFMVPDKLEITFTEVMADYGYATTEYVSIHNRPVSCSTPNVIT